MPQNAANPPGLVHAFRGALDIVVALVETRLELASIEFREEKARGAAVLLLGAAAAFAAAMVVITLTALVVVLCWDHAAWALGGFAILYACLGCMAYLALRREMDKPFFEDTIGQLKKDREWLIPRN